MNKTIRSLIMISGSVIMLTMLLTGCKKDKKSNEPAAEPVHSQVQFFQNPQDPRLFHIILDSNSFVEYIGNRSAEGLPKEVTMVTVWQSPDSSSSQLLINAQGETRKIILPNGASLEVEQVSDSIAAFVMIIPGGKQLNGNFNFREGVGYVPKFGGLGLAPRGGNLMLASPVQHNPQIVNNTELGTKMGSIKVTRCGEIPSNPPDVAVKVFRSFNGTAQPSYFPATQVAEGIYSVSVPDDLGDDIKLTAGDFCEVMVDLILPPHKGGPGGVALQTMPQLLVKLQQIIAYSNPDPEYYENAKKFAAAYGKATDAIDIWKVVKLAGCTKLEAYDFYNFAGLIYVPVTTVGGKEKAGAIVYADAAGNVPEMSINLGSEKAVDAITLSTNNPVARQGYIATAHFSCLPINTRVRMEVKGTDGYQTGISRTVTANDNGGEYTLSIQVPGAATAGIQDVIKAYVGDSEKSAELIFK